MNENSLSNGILWQIFIDELDAMTHVGLHPHEHEQAQPVTLNIALSYRGDIVDDAAAGVIDYDRYCSLLCAYLSNKQHTRLLETLAAQLAGLSFREFPTLEDIKIAIHKPKIRENASRLGVSASWTRWRYETLFSQKFADVACAL